jgi:hypothetical protein
VPISRISQTFYNETSVVKKNKICQTDGLTLQNVMTLPFTRGCDYQKMCHVVSEVLLMVKNCIKTENRSLKSAVMRIFIFASKAC